MSYHTTAITTAVTRTIHATAPFILHMILGVPIFMITPSTAASLMALSTNNNGKTIWFHVHLVALLSFLSFLDLFCTVIVPRLPPIIQIEAVISKCTTFAAMYLCFDTPSVIMCDSLTMLVCILYTSTIPMHYSSNILTLIWVCSWIPICVGAPMYTHLHIAILGITGILL